MWLLSESSWDGRCTPDWDCWQSICQESVLLLPHWSYTVCLQTAIAGKPRSLYNWKKNGCWAGSPAKKRCGCLYALSGQLEGKLLFHLRYNDSPAGFPQNPWCDSCSMWHWCPTETICTVWYRALIRFPCGSCPECFQSVLRQYHLKHLSGQVGRCNPCSRSWHLPSAMGWQTYIPLRNQAVFRLSGRSRDRRPYNCFLSVLFVLRRKKRTGGDWELYSSLSRLSDWKNRISYLRLAGAGRFYSSHIYRLLHRLCNQYGGIAGRHKRLTCWSDHSWLSDRYSRRFSLICCGNIHVRETGCRYSFSPMSLFRSYFPGIGWGHLLRKRSGGFLYN